MKLKEFIEKFILPNSLIRLWTPCDGGHQLLQEDDKNICMEWQMLKEETDVWQKKYLDNEVIGVNDIFWDGMYREAINIVIKL